MTEQSFVKARHCCRDRCAHDAENRFVTVGTSVAQAGSMRSMALVAIWAAAACTSIPELPPADGAVPDLASDAGACPTSCGSCPDLCVKVGTAYPFCSRACADDRDCAPAERCVFLSSALFVNVLMPVCVPPLAPAHCPGETTTCDLFSTSSQCRDS